MTIFKDKKNRVAEITLYELQENGMPSYTWEEDFFEIGGLPREYDEELGEECYMVCDIDYLIDYMRDFISGQGFVEPHELGDYRVNWLRGEANS